jgi:hypothetical protein
MLACTAAWLTLSMAMSQLTLEQSPAAALIERTESTEWVNERLDDGRHFRFGTQTQGPVHVYVPNTYQARSADIVIYLHGFFVNVDEAVLKHQLLSQFRDSARNAVFIVPETRSAKNDSIPWPDLGRLLEACAKRTSMRFSSQPVSVVTHSGGYRNVVPWLDNARLKRVALIDALYANEREFFEWAKALDHRLMVVGFETQARSEPLLKSREDTFVLRSVPYLFDSVTPAMRRARVVAIQSERFDHMQLIESFRFLPWLLRVL